MRYLCTVLLAGCGFSARTSNPPPADPDAAIEIDAPSDAPDAMLAPDPCNIGVTSIGGINRGQVGGNGGGANFGPLACSAAADRIVGFAVRLSNQNTLFGAPSAQGLVIACAKVSVDKNTNVGTTGTPYTIEIKGSGAEMWTPSTLSPLAMCAPGAVVNGLQTHTGPNQNLFNNVDFRCGQLNGQAQTIANPVVHVMNSGTVTTNVDTVNCNANETIVQMTNMTGSGFDSATLFCAPTVCL